MNMEQPFKFHLVDGTWLSRHEGTAITALPSARFRLRKTVFKL